MTYKYKFYYYKNFVECSLICHNEQSALNFFALLINQNIPFKVYTLKGK